MCPHSAGEMWEWSVSVGKMIGERGHAIKRRGSRRESRAR